MLRSKWIVNNDVRRREMQIIVNVDTDKVFGVDENKI